MKTHDEALRSHATELCEEWNILHPSRPATVAADGAVRTPEGYQLRRDERGVMLPVPMPPRLRDVVFMPLDDPDVAGMLDLDEVASASVASWERGGTVVAMKGYGSTAGHDVITEDFESFRRAWKGEGR